MGLPLRLRFALAAALLRHSAGLPPGMLHSPHRNGRAIDDQTSNPLASLPPLPKIHHSWPLAVNFTDPAMRPVLKDYARITHAVSLPMYWTPSQNVVNVAVSVAAETGAMLEFEYNPYGEDGSPFPRHAWPMYQGPEEKAEIALFSNRCQKANALIQRANAALDLNVSMGGILFDQERWCADCYHYLNITNVSEPVYRAAITRKNNLFYTAALQCSPGIHIEMYDRGAVGRGSGPGEEVERTGWRTPGGYYTIDPDELPGPAGAFGVALYTLSEVGLTRESFNRTAKLARLHGVPAVTPWLSLGAAYRRNFCLHDCSSPMTYDENWNYDLAYSWMIGAEVNDPWYPCTCRL